MFCSTAHFSFSGSGQFLQSAAIEPFAADIANRQKLENKGEGGENGGDGLIGRRLNRSESDPDRRLTMGEHSLRIDRIRLYTIEGARHAGR
jgi:hypothetical protein